MEEKKNEVMEREKKKANIMKVKKGNIDRES